MRRIFKLILVLFVTATLFSTNVEYRSLNALSNEDNKPTSISQKNGSTQVESYIVQEGKAIENAYMQGDDSTLTRLIPNTNADYVVRVKSNSSDKSGYIMYIPIPKAGENFGSVFQSSEFGWSMSLIELLTESSGLDVSYSTNATSDYKNASYVDNPSNLDDVNMIKINFTKSVEQGNNFDIRIKLKVDEVYDSALVNARIGKRNIYNPVYEYNEGFSTILLGTKAGAELVKSEISGHAFNDLNADGLYNNEDTAIVGHEVQLYVFDQELDKYVPAVDSRGNHYKTKTNNIGFYSFDYTYDLGYSTYAVKFSDSDDGGYGYTLNVDIDDFINSDVIISNSYPKPGDNYKGWAIGIDPTTKSAKSIGAGFVLYYAEAEEELKVKVSDEIHKLKIGEEYTLPPAIIETSNWEEIMASTDAYKWEFVDSLDSQYLKLIKTNTESLAVEAIAPTPENYTVKVRLTIKDIHNREASDIVEFRVADLSDVSVEALDLDLYVGDSLDLYDGVVATDSYGNLMELTSSNTKITTVLTIEGGTVASPGTYLVEYKVTDSYGNIGEGSRIVKVNGNVELLVNNIEVGLGTEDIEGLVLSQASASYLAASKVVGEDPIKTAVDVDGYELVSTTTTVNDFSKVGSYNLRYSATNDDNKIGYGVGVVTVVDNATEAEGNLLMRADNFYVSVNDSSILTSAAAKTFADLHAWNKVSVANMDANVIVNSLDLSAINTGGEGRYNLRFTVLSEGAVLEKAVTVFVGGELSSDKKTVLYSHNFQVHLKNVALYTEDSAKQDGGIKAYNISTGKEVTGIKVNVENINNSTHSGVVYIDITYPGLSTSVVVTIFDDNAAIGKDTGIYGENLVISKSDLSNLSQSSLASMVKTRSGSVAWDLETGDQAPYSVNTNLKSMEEGVNEVELLTSTGVSKDISVIVVANPVCDISCDSEGVSEVIGAEETVVNLSDMASATYGKAYNVKSTKPLSMSADTSNVLEKPGSYDVTVSTASGISTSTKVTVGENVAVNGDTAISASDVYLTADEVANLNSNDDLNEVIAKKSQTRVWSVSSNKTLGTSTVDSSSISFNTKSYSASSGLTYSYTSLSKSNENVAVVEFNDIMKQVDTIEASDFSISSSEVSSLSKNKIIELSNAKAWVTKDGRGVEIVNVDYSNVRPKQGVYDIVLTTSHDTSISIQVFVGENNRPIIDYENNLVIYANNVELSLSELKKLDFDEYIEYTNSMVIDKDSYEAIEMTYIDSSEVEFSKGVYPVKLGVEGAESIYATSLITISGDFPSIELTNTIILTSALVLYIFTAIGLIIKNKNA